MAGTLYITEYTGIYMMRPGVGMAAGKEPHNAQQTIAFSGVNAQSAAFSSGTKLIRVVAQSGPCHVECGSNPTATTSSKYLPENAIEYFGVNNGDIIAVIEGV